MVRDGIRESIALAEKLGSECNGSNVTITCTRTGVSVCMCVPTLLNCILLHQMSFVPKGVGGEGRPKTTAMVARRMVTSALGIRVKVSQEQRERRRRGSSRMPEVRQYYCDSSPLPVPPPPPPPPERRRLNKLKIAGELNCNDSVNARSHFTT